MEREHLWIAMAKRLVSWWDADKPDTRMDFEAAHELGGIVQLAQSLIDIETVEKNKKK